MNRALVVTLMLCACDQRPLTAGNPVQPLAAASGHSFDAHMTLATISEDVTFTAGKHEVAGTIITPKDTGPWPGIVIMAGSGPTDRDWNSPLLPGKNGSGKLLAEALAKHGAVVLRFDKALTGKTTGPTVPELTLDTYREEGLAALAFLRSRADVRKDRLFVAGHSEGGIHATRVAAAAPDLTGVIYLASAGRPMADILITQLEGQLRNPLAGLTDAQVKAELATLHAAFADFLIGKPVDPKKASSIEKLQELVAHIVAPETAAVARSLLAFDNAAEAPKVGKPVFVLNGLKDVQADPELDARRLDKAFRDAHVDVTLFLAPEANHVLKHETKDLAELHKDLLGVQNGYNAEGRQLDDAAITKLLAWIEATSR